MSDQIFQTCSGEAVVSADVPYSAIFLTFIVGRRAAGDQAVRTFLKSGHQKTDCWKCPLAPYGWDTDCRQYRKGGGCSDARLLSGVKHELAKLGFAGTNSWAIDFSVGTLVSVVLKRLKDEADAVAGEPAASVVLGHPVVFAGTDPDDPLRDQRRTRARPRRVAELALQRAAHVQLGATAHGRPRHPVDPQPHWRQRSEPRPRAPLRRARL
jgi:hypothetical protein